VVLNVAFLLPEDGTLVLKHVGDMSFNSYIYIYTIYAFGLYKLESSGIQDVRAKYKQNWIKHLKRIDNTRFPKHALNYKPRGRRDRGCPRKQWQHVDARTGQAA